MGVNSPTVPSARIGFDESIDRVLGQAAMDSMVSLCGRSLPAGPELVAAAATVSSADGATSSLGINADTGVVGSVRTAGFNDDPDCKGKSKFGKSKSKDGDDDDCHCKDKPMPEHCKHTGTHKK